MAMEIILLKDVDNLGFADDIVTVKNGYARNYLIPKGYAILATPSAKKQLEEKLKQRAHKEKHIIEQAQQLAEKIKALDIKIPAKAGKLGKLFGSINNAHIAEALKQHGIDIDKKYIKVVGGNVKRLGKYTAIIRLHREVKVELPFEVVKLEEKKEETTEEAAVVNEEAEQENNEAAE